MEEFQHQLIKAAAPPHTWIGLMGSFLSGPNISVLEIWLRNIILNFYHIIDYCPAPHLDWLDSLIPQTNIFKRGVQQYFLDFEF